MSDKRYTVFVSSTFRDLVEERQAALRAILALGHFPTGMEVFPATGAAPWDIISRVIADADYYVLIIAGRYGSTTAEGISYTEREYDEARALGKNVLAFLHGNPSELPAGKSELTAKLRRQLEKFRKRVEGAHHCKFWRDSNELALQITQGLLNAFDLAPAAGWVRAGGPDVVALLSEINELRQRIDALRDENLRLREQLAAASSAQLRVKSFDPNEVVRLCFSFGNGPRNEYDLTWGLVFDGLAPRLLEGAASHSLVNSLSRSIVADPLVRRRFPEEVSEVEAHDHRYGSVWLTDECVQSLLLGLMARGLIINRKETRHYTDPLAKSSHTAAVTMWYLTPEGQRLYLLQVST